LSTGGQIAYEAATASLKEQGDTLDGLRTRAGTILTANSIITAFLGGRALDGSDALEHIATWAGLVFFGLSAVFATLALLPLYDWSFFIAPEDVLRVTRREPGDDFDGPDFMALARELTTYGDRNSPKLNSLMWLLIVSAGSLLGAAVCWLFEIA
jgi:hypothetical protein